MYFHVVMVALQSKKTMDITKNIVNSAMNKNRSKKNKNNSNRNKNNKRKDNLNNNNL